jgi:TM2 domain-containing membrane protein YozV
MRQKEKIVAALLAFFLGEWGIHKFYLNEQEEGKKYLIWCAVGIVLAPIIIGLIPLIVLTVKKLIDCFTILFMTDDEFDEKYNGRNREILND